MSSPCFQQRRRGSSFREYYSDAIHDWSDDDFAQDGESGSGAVTSFRRSPSLTQFGKYLLPPQSDEDVRRGCLTVVFDLDETLVNARNGPLYVRPGIDKLFAFLKERGVEVVVWTSAIHKYADAVVSEIDEGSCISHVIYRHRAWFKNVASVDGATKEQNSLKSLSLLGRNLDNVVIVENTPDCLLGFEENGILVEDYDGGELADFTLFALLKLLRDLLRAREAGEVPVPSFIKNCSRLQLRSLPTDKGSITGCYCLPSHDERDENCVPLPPTTHSHSARKLRSHLLDNASVRTEHLGLYRSRAAGLYRSALAKKELSAATRRFASQKIASH